jgi:hypothetical protein
MPVPDPQELGPLAALIGTWEGDQGSDVAFHNAVGEIVETPFREHTVLNPFGPVDNGVQCLYGLDYRMAAWRGDEGDPFHTEAGYWLWDAADGQVMKCFIVPRGNAIITGGPAAATDRTFTMAAACGSPTYGILSNIYLDKAAKTTAITITVTVHDDGTWSYEETTTVDLAKMDAPFAHTDRNTLHRVADG